MTTEIEKSKSTKLRSKSSFEFVSRTRCKSRKDSKNTSNKFKNKSANNSRETEESNSVFSKKSL